MFQQHLRLHLCLGRGSLDLEFGVYRGGELNPLVFASGLLKWYQDYSAQMGHRLRSKQSPLQFYGGTRKL